MGALTDIRKKRRFLDHHRLPFFGPHPYPLPDLSPPLKKPRLPSPPPPPAILGDREPSSQPAPPPQARGTAADLRRFPPPAPLSRPIHGPQRILRAFGLGCGKPGRTRSGDTLLERNWGLEMGNFSSSCYRAKKDASDTPWARVETEEEKAPAGDLGLQGFETGSYQGLGLENYKKFVITVSQLNSAEKSVKEGSPQSVPEVLDLELVTEKVEDEREVTEQFTPVKEEKVWGKKSPWYKELYEDSIRRHDSRLSSLELEVKLAEERITSFRLARELLVKKPEENLGEPFVPLTDEEENDVYHALHGGNRREVLVVHEASNIGITRELLQCLSGCAWLNDEVINLYLELLKERERREPKKFLKCHFFNTFFYKKLISGRNGYDFRAVRRWTTQRKIGYGLIECDKIFVPIHKEVHWCLAVINIKDKKFQYLDSLGGVDATVLRVLARYFMDEAKDKSDKQIETQSWTQEAVAELPLQKNGWDCGMFMLKYADFYSRGLSLCFGQEHMQYFRMRTAKEILRLRAE